MDVQPLQSISAAHAGAVEDVDWHKQYDFLFGSAGDDHHVFLWDTRQSSSVPTNRLENAHKGDVHCLAFNAFSEFLMATGGADKCVNLWDLRNLSEKVHTFEGHAEEVMMVNWAPFSDTILASCSSDRRVIIWDVSKVGEEQSPEDAEDGPPELLFSHGGHTSRVSDFSWNLNDQWVVASVEEENSLQVWQLVRNSTIQYPLLTAEPNESLPLDLLLTSASSLPRITSSAQSDEIISGDDQEAIDDDDLEAAEDEPVSKKQKGSDE